MESRRAIPSPRCYIAPSVTGAVMRTWFAMILTSAWIILTSQPANSQPAAITPQCLNALRERALGSTGLPAPITPRVMRPLGIPGDTWYPTRQIGFVDGDGTRNAFAVGPENPPRLLLARLARPGRLASVHFWLMDRD